MTRKFVLLLCILFSSCAQAQTPPRPVAGLERVMIISIDGLRPDLLLRGDTPTIHALLRQSAFSFWARTTAESVTLPSHTSMLTGVTPVRHEVQWNKDLPLEHPVYPVFPTLFEVAHRAGYTTAMAAGKSKFINLAKPGSLDWQYVPKNEKSNDLDVTEQALQMIDAHRPEVMFIHFPSVDNVGHAAGWASDSQMRAIANADHCVGAILSMLDELNLRTSTMIIITSDHGGAGITHGPEDPRSRSIPWIANGPGVRKGLDLTTYDKLTIDTEDTFCTACFALGLHPPQLPLDGKPVVEIFDRTGQELTQNR